MNNQEKILLNTALQKFENETGFRTGIFAQDNKTDIILKIEEYELTFNVELKLFLNKGRLGILLDRIKGIEGILLVTEYVTPEMMKILETNRVNFIDAAGNAYINIPPLFVKIKGNKLVSVGNGNKRDKKTSKEAANSWNSAEIQTIYALFCIPGIERKSIREIAEKAGVSHGTAHNTLTKLAKQDFILGNNPQRMLVNKKPLLEQWVVSYLEKLRTNIRIGRYKLDGTNIIEDIALKQYNALWGGEKAAAMLTNYLRPYIYTVYINKKQGEFILRNRLKKSRNGNLILMRKFWNFNTEEFPDTTHPILLYADLLSTNDPRNIEAAKIIYEKYIVKYLQ